MTYQEWKEKAPREEVMTVSDRISTSPPAEPVAEPEAEVEAVVEAEPVAEVEPEAEPEAEVKEEVEAEPEAEVKAEVEAEPEAEPEAVPEPEPESAPAEIAVTVEELQSAFSDDVAGAEGKFVDKILKITGFVGRIAVNDIIDSPCVVLTSSEKTVLRNVLCVFDKKHAPKLKLLVPGQTVTVQGKYDSCTINILVTDCILVS